MRKGLPAAAAAVLVAIGSASFGLASSSASAAVPTGRHLRDGVATVTPTAVAIAPTFPVMPPVSATESTWQTYASAEQAAFEAVTDGDVLDGCPITGVSVEPAPGIAPYGIVLSALSYYMTQSCELGNANTSTSGTSSPISPSLYSCPSVDGSGCNQVTNTSSHFGNTVTTFATIQVPVAT